MVVIKYSKKVFYHSSNSFTVEKRVVLLFNYFNVYGLRET